jgi:hypothetical protein
MPTSQPIDRRQAGIAAEDAASAFLKAEGLDCWR